MYQYILIYHLEIFVKKPQINKISEKIEIRTRQTFVLNYKQSQPSKIETKVFVHWNHPVDRN